jgi:hypothetical protein
LEMFQASFSRTQISAAPPFQSHFRCTSLTVCSHHRGPPRRRDCLPEADAEMGLPWLVLTSNQVRGSPEIGSSSRWTSPFLPTRNRAPIVERQPLQPRHQNQRARPSICR